MMILHKDGDCGDSEEGNVETIQGTIVMLTVKNNGVFGNGDLEES